MGVMPPPAAPRGEDDTQCQRMTGLRCRLSQADLAGAIIQLVDQRQP